MHIKIYHMSRYFRFLVGTGLCAALSIGTLQAQPTLTEGTTPIRVMSSVDEDDATNTGMLVSNIGTSNPIGLGRVLQSANNLALGTWQYQVNGAGVWMDVSETGFTLLNPNDRLRFNATDIIAPGSIPTITLYPWTRDANPAPTSGANENARLGIQNLSGVDVVGTDVIEIQAFIVPVIALGGLNDMLTVRPDARGVGDMGVQFNTLGVTEPVPAMPGDIPDGTVNRRVITNAENEGLGTWESSIDNGANWAAVPGGVTLWTGANRLRFNATRTGVAVPSIQVYAWSQLESGSGTDYGSLADARAEAAISMDFITVTANITNAVPTITGLPVSRSISEDVDVATLNGDRLGSLGTAADTDVGTGTVTILGRAIAAVNTQGKGNWQFSIDAGTSWSNLGAIAAGNARPLGPDDRVRFVPDPNTNTSDSNFPALTLHAWDSTTGTANVVSTVAALGTSISTAVGDLRVTITAVNDPIGFRLRAGLAFDTDFDIADISYTPPTAPTVLDNDRAIAADFGDATMLTEEIMLSRIVRDWSVGPPNEVAQTYSWEIAAMDVILNVALDGGGMQHTGTAAAALNTVFATGGRPSITNGVGLVESNALTGVMLTYTVIANAEAVVRVRIRAREDMAGGTFATADVYLVIRDGHCS